MRKLIIALAPLVLFATPAEARTARCVIDSGDFPTWAGPCDFEAESDGSFAISPLEGAFPGGVSDITVSITEPGVAEVRGLTSRGVNSRWGIARRSGDDPACWVGEDFMICAY